MNLKYQQKKTLIHFIFLLVLVIGGFMRFYNLDWGSGYFFHPDERLVGTAIINLDFAKGDFNPDFLNYGSLPIYLMHMLSGSSFDNGLLIGRLMAAVLSTLTIALVYYTVLEVLTFFRQKSSPSKSVIEKNPIIENIFALGAAVFTAFSFGMIQGAHYTTPEIYLVFEYTLIFYLSLKLIRFGHRKYYLLLAITLAAAIATKIVSITLLPVLILAHFLYLLSLPDKSLKQRLLNKKQGNLLLTLIVLVVLTFIFSPYYFLDFNNFTQMFTLESDLAKGLLPIFYTQQFIQTTPIIYQLSRIFPYILNWPLTILWVYALVYLLIILGKGIIKKNILVFPILLLLFIQALYGGVNFLQFVKWTRYMLPLSPFIIISVTLFLYYSYKKLNVRILRNTLSGFFVLLIIWTILQGFDYFSIYLQPDPRIAAYKWTEDYYGTDKKILAEPYDMGMMIWGTFKPDTPNIYDLEVSNDIQVALEQALSKVEVVVIPSNRIYESRFRLPQIFPKGYLYYKNLFAEKLGFKIVNEFKRKRLSELIFGSQPLTHWKNYSYNELMPDETFDVYDNPTVLIFEKIK